MKKPGLLLLDANVVICLFEIGIWEKVIGRCEVYLARTVMGEAEYYEDAGGKKHSIDLKPYEISGKVAVVDVVTSDLKEFKGRFSPEYLEKLDPGETESLAYLLSGHLDHALCSSDPIVFRVLGASAMSERGISLEEVLGHIGMGRKLRGPYTKQFRERWTKQGFEEGLQGRSFKEK